MKLAPWQVDGNPWKSESKFIGYLRGVLRKGWSRYPIKLQYIKANRKRITNPNPNAPERFKEVWGGTCEICQHDHVQKDMEIDHKGDQGTFTTMSDIEGFARHLFYVTLDDLRWICKKCHKIVSHSQRSGSSFDEASFQKDVIEIMKQPTDDVIEFIESYGDYETTNTTKRKQSVVDILREYGV